MQGPSVAFRPLELLLLQPTPFCNINCKYCYLPNRSETRRMQPETVLRTIDGLISGGFVDLRKGIDLNWHIGEPLTVPISHYRKLFEAIDVATRERCPVQQSLQTNGTLITQAWCDFFREFKMSIGVSIDGPSFLHDSIRTTRSSSGTHAQVMNGIRLLQLNGISVTCLAVVSRRSLLFPDEIIDFFLANGIRYVGFNREDVVGSNNQSSLTNQDDEAIRAFMARLYERQQKSGGQLSIREFAAISHWIRENGRNQSATSVPMSVVNVDVDGNFSTFSPQLLGQTTREFGSFTLGNVHQSKGNPFIEALQSEHFQRIYQAISSGVDACRDSCPYFSVCGGGDAANKLYENCNFSSTETAHCRFHIKAPLDALVLYEAGTTAGTHV